MEPLLFVRLTPPVLSAILHIAHLPCVEGVTVPSSRAVLVQLHHLYWPITEHRWE